MSYPAPRTQHPAPSTLSPARLPVPVRAADLAGALAGDVGLGGALALIVLAGARLALARVVGVRALAGGLVLREALAALALFCHRAPLLSFESHFVRDACAAEAARGVRGKGRARALGRELRRRRGV